MNKNILYPVATPYPSVSITGKLELTPMTQNYVTNQHSEGWNMIGWTPYHGLITLEIYPYTIVTLFQGQNHTQKFYEYKNDTNKKITKRLEIPDNINIGSMTATSTRQIEGFESDNNGVYLTYTELFIIFLIMLLIIHCMMN